MKVEISKEEIDALEVAVNFGIKSSAILQMIALTSPDAAGVIKLDDILRANISMSKSLDFLRKLGK